MIHYDEDKQTITLSINEYFELIEKCNHPMTANCPTTNSTSTWLDGKQLCEHYPCLAYNNVKDSKWRKNHDFPCYQDGPYAHVTYNTHEVEIWIGKNIKAKNNAKC